MHQVFYGHLPERYRWTATQAGTERVRIVPGAWRDRPVVVGDHIPPEVARLPEFLARFTEAYQGCTWPVWAMHWLVAGRSPAGARAAFRLPGDPHPR